MAFHAEQAGRCVPGTFNYYALSVDGRHYLPIGAKVVVASRLQLGNIRPVGERSGQRAVLEEVLSRRRDAAFAGGADTKSARSAIRDCRSAATACGVQRGAARRSPRQAGRGALPRRRQRVGGLLGHGPQRSALRGRSRAALPDADRPDPVRLSAISSIRIPTCSSTASRSSAAGAFTSASGRRSRAMQRFRRIRDVLDGLFTRVILVLDAGRRRDRGHRHRVADGVVQELAARLHRARSRASI